MPRFWRSKNWTDVRQFNLMFKTQMGTTAEGASDLYLRPETAQGIFVQFLERTKNSANENSFWDSTKQEKLSK